MNFCTRAIVLCALLIVPPIAVAQRSTDSMAENSDQAVGKIRQAIADARSDIAMHPNDPHSYVEMAYALSDAGANDLAVVQARKATEVAPKSAFAFSAQGWILRHNALGVDFGKGFAYDAALASYRKAMELDPSDVDIRISLADFFERNRSGIQYAPDAQLSDAIELLRYVKQHASVVDPKVQENLALDLFYAGAI